MNCVHALKNPLTTATLCALALGAAVTTLPFHT
jgi:hypothetical protein